MEKSLSFDTILAALAVLSLTGAACSKQEPARAEPAAAPPPVNAPTPAIAPQPTTAAPGDDGRISDTTAQPAVDAGTESRPSPAPSGKKPVHAACGATGCSPDMKKK